MMMSPQCCGAGASVKVRLRLRKKLMVESLLFCRSWSRSRWKNTPSRSRSKMDRLRNTGWQPAGVSEYVPLKVWCPFVKIFPRPAGSPSTCWCWSRSWGASPGGVRRRGHPPLFPPTAYQARTSRQKKVPGKVLWTTCAWWFCSWSIFGRLWKCLFRTQAGSRYTYKFFPRSYKKYLIQKRSTGN